MIQQCLNTDIYIVALIRGRTEDLTINSRTLYQLSYGSKAEHFNDIFRSISTLRLSRISMKSPNEGLEPSTTGLKGTRSTN